MMGKRGSLVAVTIPAKAIRALGLTIIPTKGGTDNPAVDAVHFEARLSLVRRLFLWLGRVRPHEYFNSHFSQRLCAIARVVE